MEGGKMFFSLHKRPKLKKHNTVSSWGELLFSVHILTGPSDSWKLLL